MIGVFDSGFGGLTVLKEFQKVLPQYEYLYLADNAYVPYGDKTPEVIKERSKKCCEYLFEQGAKLIIIACNTATIHSIRWLQQEVFPDKKILGVTIPAVEEVAEQKLSEICVIGTEQTIKSNEYTKRVQELDPGVIVHRIAMPKLVPLLEAGKIHDEETNTYLKDLLLHIVGNQCDGLVLGCTHYEILVNNIANLLPDLRIISPAKSSAYKLTEYLKKHTDIETQLSMDNLTHFRCTGDKDIFETISPLFLEREVQGTKKIHL